MCINLAIRDTTGFESSVTFYGEGPCTCVGLLPRCGRDDAAICYCAAAAVYIRDSAAARLSLGLFFSAASFMAYVGGVRRGRAGRASVLRKLRGIMENLGIGGKGAREPVVAMLQIIKYILRMY